MNLKDDHIENEEEILKEDNFSLKGLDLPEEVQEQVEDFLENDQEEEGEQTAAKRIRAKTTRKNPSAAAFSLAAKAAPAGIPSSKKAAILLMSLNAKMPGVSQQILEKIGKEPAKIILQQMSQLGKVESDVIDEVIEEFYSLAITQDVLIGGKNITKQLLKDSFGIDDSEDYFSQKKGLFAFMNQVPDNQLIQYLNTENNQVKALILSFLSDDRTATILSSYPPADTGLISQTILSLEVPNYAYLWRFSRLLETRLLGDAPETVEDTEQLFKLSRVLEMMGLEKRNTVMEIIEQRDKESAEKIKQLIFSYTDLEYMADKDFQMVLVEIDPFQTLADSMVGIPAGLKDKIMTNISERLKARLDEALLGVEELSEEEVQEAQGSIVQICRRMEESGRIAPLSECLQRKQEQGAGASTASSTETKSEEG